MDGLFGGGGAPQGGGIPPELIQGFRDGMMDGEGEGGGGQMSVIDHLRQAIEHAQAALVGEKDDADSQQLAKIVQGLYQIFAQRQKEEQSVLGNPATQRVVARSAPE